MNFDFLKSCPDAEIKVKAGDLNKAYEKALNTDARLKLINDGLAEIEFLLNEKNNPANFRSVSVEDILIKVSKLRELV